MAPLSRPNEAARRRQVAGQHPPPGAPVVADPDPVGGVEHRRDRLGGGDGISRAYMFAVSPAFRVGERAFVTPLSPPSSNDSSVLPLFWARIRSGLFGSIATPPPSAVRMSRHTAPPSPRTVPLSCVPATTMASLVGCWSKYVGWVIASVSLTARNDAGVPSGERNTPPSQPIHTSPATSAVPGRVAAEGDGVAVGVHAGADPQWGAIRVGTVGVAEAAFGAGRGQRRPVEGGVPLARLQRAGFVVPDQAAGDVDGVVGPGLDGDGDVPPTLRVDRRRLRREGLHAPELGAVEAPQPTQLVEAVDDLVGGVAHGERDPAGVGGGVRRDRNGVPRHTVVGREVHAGRARRDGDVAAAGGGEDPLVPAGGRASDHHVADVAAAGQEVAGAGGDLRPRRVRPRRVGPAEQAGARRCPHHRRIVRILHEAVDRLAAQVVGLEVPHPVPTGRSRRDADADPEVRRDDLRLAHREVARLAGADEDRVGTGVGAELHEQGTGRQRVAGREVDERRGHHEVVERRPHVVVDAADAHLVVLPRAAVGGGGVGPVAVRADLDGQDPSADHRLGAGLAADAAGRTDRRPVDPAEHRWGVGLDLLDEGAGRRTRSMRRRTPRPRRRRARRCASGRGGPGRCPRAARRGRR